MVLKSKLNGRNKITAINSWAVAVFRYAAGILQYDSEKRVKLKDDKLKSRRTMTLYGALNPKSNVDRLYIKRKEGGRGMMVVEHCIREEEISLVFCVANSEENVIKGVAAAETINTEDTATS